MSERAVPGPVGPATDETITIPRRLLAELTDLDPCWFDHHGGCQAHGFLEPEPGEECPHAEAKRLLAGEGLR